MDCTYKTNHYHMPLLHVVGMTSFNTSFSMCFAFLSKETEMEYAWALQQIAQLFDGMHKPAVIVTDCELALMNALECIFPNSAHMLCIWHIHKNILSKCKSKFLDGEAWDQFYSSWMAVENALMIADFHGAW